MTERKLIRATVPMCPHCSRVVRAEIRFSYFCAECGHHSSHPDYGYYAPDVVKVVREMLDAVELYERTTGKSVLTVNIADWAKRLEGS